jgi:hypothetical protein
MTIPIRLMLYSIYNATLSLPLRSPSKAIARDFLVLFM